MSGIVGIVTTPDEGTRVQERLLAMAQPLRRRIEMRAAQHASQQAGLAAVSLGTEGAMLARRAGVWLAVSGAVVGREQLARGLDLADGPDGLAELLLARFLTMGVAGVCDLNGSYAAAIWEEGPRRLTILKDRLGGGSNLYYWHKPGVFLFASEMKAFFSHPAFHAEVDELGVADLFLHQFVIGERTLLKAVRSMPAASVLTYQADRVTVARYWQPVFNPVNGGTPQVEEAVEGLAHYLQQAVARRVRPNTCLMVTGGLDSRTALGFYRRAAPELPLLTATVGKPGGQDLHMGSDIARAAGLPHLHIPLDSGYLAHYTPLAAWRLEGKLNGYGSWIFAAEPFLQARHVQYVMTGLFGNLISGRHYPQGMAEAGDLAAQLAVVRGQYQRKWRDLQRLMRPEIFARTAEASLDGLLSIYRASPASDPWSRFDHLSIHLMLARAAQTSDVLGDAATALEPFTDLDLFDFALRLPPEIRARSDFYMRMIARYLPEMAAQPHSRTGFPLTTDLWIRQRPLIEKATYYSRQVFKRLLPQFFSDEALSCVPHAEAIRSGSRDFMAEALSREEYLGDLFDMRVVRQMLEDHWAGRANHYLTLDGLATFSWFVRMFLDGEGFSPSAGPVFAAYEMPEMV